MTSKRYLGFLLSTVTLAGAVPALAQTATAPSSRAPNAAGAGATADQTGAAGDIVVTANKREERLIEVPMSITAVSGDDLNRRQLLDIQDLATRVPGFAFQRGGNGPSQRLILRGLNTGGAGATVASVIDDVPLSFSTANSDGAEFATDIDPFDLQRVEVLKGAQGTLYGAAAEGGLVKYVTKAPDFTGTHMGFDVGGFDLSHGGGGASGKVFLNEPIATDVAAVRSSVFYEYSPGWIHNNVGHDAKSNGFKRYGFRGSLLVQATPALTLRATALYQALDQDGPDTVEVYGVQTPARQFDLLHGYNFDTYVQQPSRSKTQIYYGNVDYDFGGAKFQSITSYGKLNTSFTFDNPIYVPLGALFYGFVNTTLASNSLSALKKFSQEFRLSSSNDAAATGHGLEWQIGAFYTREVSSYTNNYITRDATTGAPVVTSFSTIVTPPGSSQVFLATLNSRYRELAGYADATYHFAPIFDLEVGGRVFNNHQSFDQTTGGALFSPPTTTSIGPFSSEETAFTYAVAPRLHFSGSGILYARVASGYRPGGPNPAIPAPAAGEPVAPGTSYKRDKTVNYEVGVKATLFHIFTADISAFRIDWTDIQVNVTVPRGATGYQATINAGKARSQGVEAKLDVRPFKGLSITALGAYTDATLKTNVPQIYGTAGSQLPYVPKWQESVSADYEFPLGNDLRGYFGGTFSRTGNRFTAYNFFPARSHLPIPGYSTWAAQLGVRTDKFGVQLYGKNLTDTRGITTYSSGQTIVGLFLPGSIGLIRPREIGVRLTGAF